MKLSMEHYVIRKNFGDAEAIRIIRSMPNWIPGKQRGEPVRVRFTLPVMFRLQ